MKFEFSRRIYTNSVVVIAVLLLMFALKSASLVLLPIIMSVFIYLVFYPFINKMHKRGFCRWFIVLISILILVLLLLLFLVVFAYTIERLIYTITEYEDMAESIYKRAELFFHERFKIVIQPRDGNIIAGFAGYFAGYFRNNFSFFRNLIASIVLILVYDFFLFMDHDKIRRMVAKYIRKKRTMIAIELTIRQVSYYMGVKFIVSLLTAVIFWVIMAAYGMKSTLVLAALVFMLNFIPTVGSIVATLVISVLAFLQFWSIGSLTSAIVITGLCVLTQFIIGNIVDPQFTGKRVRLSPLIVLISLTVWSYLLGPVGMILAVPMTCMIKNFLKYGGLML
ncbi:MAG TPA: hypothetical protein DCO86_00675 [Spirochaetaceae bacterium]|nr:hypothetical protein [Spirochaetaceae bacterium]